MDAGFDPSQIQGIGEIDPLTMSEVENFLDRLRQGQRVSFTETQNLIARHYHYTPVGFATGFGAERVENAPRTNEGSCKILFFAMLQKLDPNQTLYLFGDYYWIDVLNDPHGDNHRNLRNFMRHGWDGVDFFGAALSPRMPT